MIRLIFVSIVKALKKVVDNFNTGARERTLRTFSSKSSFYLQYFSKNSVVLIIKCIHILFKVFHATVLATVQLVIV